MKMNINACRREKTSETNKKGNIELFLVFPGLIVDSFGSVEPHPNEEKKNRKWSEGGKNGPNSSNNHI